MLRIGIYGGNAIYLTRYRKNIFVEDKDSKLIFVDEHTAHKFDPEEYTKIGYSLTKEEEFFKEQGCKDFIRIPTTKKVLEELLAKYDSDVYTEYHFRTDTP